MSRCFETVPLECIPVADHDNLAELEQLLKDSELAPTLKAMQSAILTTESRVEELERLLKALLDGKE